MGLRVMKKQVANLLLLFASSGAGSQQPQGAAIDTADAFVVNLGTKVLEMCAKPMYLQCIEISESQCREAAPATTSKCEESTKTYLAQNPDRDVATGRFFGCVVGSHIALSEKKLASKIYCIKHAK